MITRSIGVIAATALTAANAFLLPPSVVTDATGDPFRTDATSDPFSITITPPDEFVTTVKPPSSYDVQLICHDCETPKDSKDKAQFDVSITTLLNGYGVGLPESYALYPPLASYMKPTIRLTTPPEEVKDVQITADSSIVSEKASKDGESLITIKYQINSVDHSKVTVDPIVITAVKGTDNAISIIKVETEAEDKAPKTWKGAKHSKPCDLPPMLCHFREIFEDKMSDLKKNLPTLSGLRRPDCLDGKTHGKVEAVHLPGHLRPGAQPVGSHHHGKPHGGQFRHHRPHFHGHHDNAFVRIIKTVTIVLIPILLGITMGIVVSLIGMIVGRLVSCLWIHFVRGGKRGYASVRLNEDEAEADDAKEADVESVAEAPPMYEDVPEYTEKAGH